MAESDELPDEVKIFIVQGLACFDSPKTVADSVKEEFGLTVTRQRVHRYNPTRKAGEEELAEKWVALFNATRDAFLKDTAQVGIANKSVRLRKLQRVVDAAEGRNPVLVIAACEAAAKEMGGAFTNRREHTGRDGGAIQTENKVVTDRDRAKAVASLVAKSKAAGAGTPAPAQPTTKSAPDGNKPA